MTVGFALLYNMSILISLLFVILLKCRIKSRKKLIPELERSVFRTMFQLKINSILVDENHEKFFGNGPLSLLTGVEQFGSLSASAKAMEMSYSKANKLIRHAEEALGFPLLESHSGGRKGGSSTLSQKGKLFLALYREYASANRIYGENHLENLILPERENDVRIVIMASGKGRRFKGNKLLHEVDGKPLILYLLKTLAPLKESCMVSTIHEEVAKIAAEEGYPYNLHTEEERSASVRYGLSDLKEGCASMFIPGDQPLLTLTSVVALIEAYHKNPDRFYKLSYEGKKASPTLFPAKYMGELKMLSNDEGGSSVIKRHPDVEVNAVEALFPWELWDVDEKDDLRYIDDLIRYMERGKR